MKLRADRPVTLKPSDGDVVPNSLLWCHLINAPAIVLFCDDRLYGELKTCSVCECSLYDADPAHEIIGVIPRPWS